MSTWPATSGGRSWRPHRRRSPRPGSGHLPGRPAQAPGAQPSSIGSRYPQSPPGRCRNGIIRAAKLSREIRGFMATRPSRCRAELPHGSEGSETDQDIAYDIAIDA